MALQDDLKSFLVLPGWQQVGVFALIGALLIGAYFYIPYKEKKQEIESLESQKSQVYKEVLKGREAKKRSRELEDQIKKIKANIEQLKEILPESFEVQRVFEEITNRVRDAGLNLNVFRPFPPVTPSDAPYRIHPMEVNAQGSYHALGRFFERLASMKRLANVERFKVRIIDRKSSPPRLQIVMRVVTYTYIEPTTRKK